MKKQKQNKETLLQYIFDNGIENTCKQWCLTEEQLDKTLNPDIDSAPKIRSIKSNSITINAEVANIISKNYNNLWDKYVKDKEKLSMCQTSEDIFQTTLLKVMEELSEIDEKQVLEYIDYKLKMVDFQVRQDQKQLYKHQIYLEDANNQQTQETEN